jgi:hypothetical protein
MNAVTTAVESQILAYTLRGAVQAASRTPIAAQTAPGSEFAAAAPHRVLVSGSYAASRMPLRRRAALAVVCCSVTLALLGSITMGLAADADPVAVASAVNA